MFTGIIQAVGRIVRSEDRGGDRRLVVDSGPLPMTDTADGDSIAVNGVCLTAVDVGRAGFSADVSAETLALTTLGELAAGSAVNLESALRAGQPLGGHLVTGHVDAVSQVRSLAPDGRSVRVRVALPPALAKFVAPKGSIAIDGVSLTVNDVDADSFGVNIVPHTLAATLVGGYAAGTRVNVEIDIIARYVARMLAIDGGSETTRR